MSAPRVEAPEQIPEDLRKLLSELLELIEKGDERLMVESDDALQCEVGYAGLIDGSLGVYSVTYSPNGPAEDTWWFELDAALLSQLVKGEMGMVDLWRCDPECGNRFSTRDMWCPRCQELSDLLGDDLNADAGVCLMAWGANEEELVEIEGSQDAFKILKGHQHLAANQPPSVIRIVQQNGLTMNLVVLADGRGAASIISRQPLPAAGGGQALTTVGRASVEKLTIHDFGRAREIPMEHFVPADTLGHVVSDFIEASMASEDAMWIPDTPFEEWIAERQELHMAWIFGPEALDGSDSVFLPTPEALIPLDHVLKLSSQKAVSVEDSGSPYERLAWKVLRLLQREEALELEPDAELEKLADALADELAKRERPFDRIDETVDWLVEFPGVVDLYLDDAAFKAVIVQAVKMLAGE